MSNISLSKTLLLSHKINIYCWHSLIFYIPVLPITSLTTCLTKLLPVLSVTLSFGTCNYLVTSTFQQYLLV